MSLINSYRYGSAAPIEGTIIFRSVSSVSTTFSVRSVGADNPIWSDGVNVFQPVMVGGVSTVTFPWTDASEKTVVIVVDVPGDIRGISETEFINKGLTYIDLSKCINYRDSIILTNNNLLTTFIAPSTTVRLDSLKGINLAGCDITGPIDLSPIYGFTRGQLFFNDNINVTSFIPPQFFDDIEDFSASNVGWITLDLSTLIQNSAGTRSLNIASIYLVNFISPLVNQTDVINNFNGSSDFAFPNLAGTIDLSMYSNLRSFYLNRSNNSVGAANTDCTLIKLPKSSNLDFYMGNFDNAQIDGLSGPFIFTGRQMRVSDFAVTTSFDIGDNAPTSSTSAGSSFISNMPELIGTLNLAWYKGSGGLTIGGCPKVTGLILPNGLSGSYGAWNFTGFNVGFYIDFTIWPQCLKTSNRDFRFNDNNMSADIVNHILVDLAAIASSETFGGDFVNRNIFCDGNNAAPDGTSGGFDGLTAITDLANYGITVISN